MIPQLTAAIALLIGLSGATIVAPHTGESARKYQTIDILYPVGAVCTISDSTGLVRVKERTPSENPAIGFETNLIEVPASHENLTVTCRRADGWSQTRILIYGPSRYTSSNAPCAPPQTCPQTPWGSEFTVYEYPTVVRMYADDPPKH